MPGFIILLLVFLNIKPGIIDIKDIIYFIDSPAILLLMITSLKISWAINYIIIYCQRHIIIILIFYYTFL